MKVRYQLTHPAHAARKLIMLARDHLDAWREPDRLPLPPLHLRRRVAGHNVALTWNAHGDSLLNDIRQFIAPVPVTGQVLDFGCGPGRIVRALHQRTDAQVTGCDIDREAIRWASTHLPGRFHATNPEPPLPLPDRTIDLIIGLSVFTHLPEDHQQPWLEEFRRILKPGGHAILTYHGSRTNIPAAYQQTFDDRGFVYYGPTTDGLPDHYRTAVHTEQYIRQVWGQTLEVLKVQDLVIDGWQGAALLRA